MDLEDLKKYLEIVVDVEKSCLFQEKSLLEVQNNITALPKPQPKVITPPQKPNEMGMGDYLGFFFQCALFCIIVAGIVCLFGFDFLTVVTILIVVLFPLLIYSSIRNNRNNEAKYKKAMISYKKAIQEDQERIQGEIQCYEKIRTYFLSEVATISNHREQSLRFLKQLYSCNVIFPKYRNLIMVSSLYEYLCAGRCSSLEGSDGAYNLLEDEIRTDRIIAQLDRIIVQLDAIRQNQYMLYDLIKDVDQHILELQNSNKKLLQTAQTTNYNIVQLNAEINKLQRSSQLTAYYAGRTQKELEYMNQMNYYAGKYDNAGFFMKRPPT